MKVPTHATSMNETPIRKYFTEQLLVESSQANDPDCCAEYFMANQQVPAGSPIRKNNVLNLRFTGRCDSSSLRLIRNHNRIGANVLPISCLFQYCVFDHIFCRFFNLTLLFHKHYFCVENQGEGGDVARWSGLCCLCRVVAAVSGHGADTGDQNGPESKTGEQNYSPDMTTT